MDKKDHYSYGLDILRLLCTAVVLIYHVLPDAIPGGFLAVCSFLVLHGYLYVLSFHRSRSSIVGRYVKRIIRLYIPMAIVVALSIYALRYFPNIIWLNEKPETVSALSAVNNWWQINAGQSYFARLTNSPFTHLWYISLLLQEEIFLPLICYAYDHLKKKLGFWPVYVPFLIQAVATAMILPSYCAKGFPQMRIYYGTDARMFSTLFGMALAFRHEQKRFSPSWMKKGPLSVLSFLSLTAGLIYLFFTITPDSDLFNYSFLIASALTLPIISLATNEDDPLFSQTRNPITRFLSSFSYEIYLTHYPLLFFALSETVLEGKMLFYYIGAVMACSFILHFAMDIRFKKDVKTILLSIVKMLVLSQILYIAFFGAQDIYAAKDNTQEMADLEIQLAENAKFLEEQQALYEERQKEKAEHISDPLAYAEEVDAENLPVSGIGDSVMLGAIRVLYETFPNGDFDAQQNRSHYPVMRIVSERAADGTLGNPVIIGIGTNNVLPIEDLRTIIRSCGDREIFWLTTTNDWQFKNNDTIHSLGDEFENVTIVDWEAASRDHGEYFFSDGIHLTTEGRAAYATLIKQSIENVYGEKIAAIRKEEYLENRILGIGSSWLMASASSVQASLENCIIIAEEKPDPASVLEQIRSLKEQELMPRKCFFVVGTNDSDEDLISVLLPELEGIRILIFVIPPGPNSISPIDTDNIESSYPDASVYKWDISYRTDPDYYLADRVHLSQTGIDNLTSSLLSVMDTSWIGTD